MNSNMKSLVKFSGYISLIVYFCLVILKKPIDLIEYIELLSESVGLVIFIVLTYEKWLWRFNPLIKTPKFKKEYSGLLKYNYGGTLGEKEVEISIKQTLLSTRIKIKTDEIISKSITSEMLEEDGEYVLYYSYKTNPLSEYSDKNPIQFGTCRLLIDDVEQFQGQYTLLNQ